MISQQRLTLIVSNPAFVSIPAPPRPFYHHPVFTVTAVVHAGRCHIIEQVVQQLLTQMFEQTLTPCLPPSLTHSLTLHPSDTHIHTHSSNYGNQQADPISVSCLLSPGGWLPDHLTLHNLIWQGVTPRLLTPPAARVCVCAYSSMCKCVGPH